MSEELLVVLKLLIVITVGIVLYGISRRGLQSLQKRELLTLTAISISMSIVKWLLIISVVLTGLNIIGISVTSLWASLSAVLMLVAIGFVAVWSILSNVSAALLLVISAPFRIGDEIEILEPSTQDPEKSGLRGRIKDISFFYTTLEEPGEAGQGRLVRVPNNLFFQKAVLCRPGKDTKGLKQALFNPTGEKEKTP